MLSLTVDIKFLHHLCVIYWYCVDNLYNKKMATSINFVVVTLMCQGSCTMAMYDM